MKMIFFKYGINSDKSSIINYYIILYTPKVEIVLDINHGDDTSNTYRTPRHLSLDYVYLFFVFCRASQFSSRTSARFYILQKIIAIRLSDSMYN